MSHLTASILSTLRRLATPLAAGGLMLASAAHAGGVYFSVNVDAPLVPIGRVATVVTNAPAYGYGQPVYVQPAAPVYYQPAPQVYYRPAPPVYVQPAPVVYRPAPVVVPAPVVYEPRWGWDDRHHHHHHDDDGRRMRRDDRGGDGVWYDARR